MRKNAFAAGDSPRTLLSHSWISGRIIEKEMTGNGKGREERGNVGEGLV